MKKVHRNGSIWPIMINNKSQLGFLMKLLLFISLTLTQALFAQLCANGEPECGKGADKTCCASSYSCQNFVCVFDKNKYQKIKLPQLKSKTENDSIEPTEVKLVPTKQSSYSVSRGQKGNIELHDKMRHSNIKDYDELPKGNYVRCYDGDIIEIKGESRASLHSCKDKGGVFEYRIKK